MLGKKILVLNNRCNSEPVVIENNLSGMIDKRNSPEFIDRCEQLRAVLAESGAAAQGSRLT